MSVRVVHNPVFPRPPTVVNNITYNQYETSHTYSHERIISYAPLPALPPKTASAGEREHRILGYSPLPPFPTHILCPITSNSLPDSPNNKLYLVRSTRYTVRSHAYPQPHFYTFTEFHSCQILSSSIRTNILDEVTQNP